MLHAILALMAAAQRTVECPLDYQMVGKRCVKSVEVAPTKSCAGGIMQGGVCVSSFPPVLKCDGGSVRVGNLCETRTEVPRVKKIPPVGFKDNGSAYERILPLKQVSFCPAGNLVDDECIIEKEVPAVPKRYCANNSSLDSKGCLSIVPLELQPVCEDGTYIDGMCVRYAEQPVINARESCAEGTERVGDVCVKEVSGMPVLKCQDLTDPNEYGLCEKKKMLKILPTPRCPPGYEISADMEFCEQEVVGTIISECPSGSYENGDECVIQEYAEPQVTAECPEGFTEHAGKDLCYKTEIYDCSPTPNSGKAALRGRDSNVRTITQECERKETAPKEVTKTCPATFEVSGAGCEKLTNVDKKRRCSFEGKDLDNCNSVVKSDIRPHIDCVYPAVLENNVCTVTETTTPDQYCEGTLQKYDDDCKTAVESSLQVSVACAPGYKMSEQGDRCTKTTSSSPKMVCEEQSLPANDCVMRSYSAPVERLACPDGAIQRGAECFRKTIIKPQLMCENGNGIKECNESEIRPYEYQCPHYARGAVPLMSSKKQKCYEVINSPLEEVCETGLLVNGMCVESFEFVERCPAGYRLIGDTCYGKEYADLIVTYTKQCTGKNCDA